MLRYKIVPVTPFEQNCSILWCDTTRKAAVVDPGGDVERIVAAVAELGVTVEGLPEAQRAVMVVGVEATVVLCAVPQTPSAYLVAMQGAALPVPSPSQDHWK